MDTSQEDLNSVEYNIDNIIESAVDELLQQKVTAHSDYNDIDVLLLSLCRLCAREATQMIDISDVYWLLISELKITGIDDTTACTTICGSCMGFLEEIKQFRDLCEEGQKRIIAILTQQDMLPDFLNLDFTDSKKDSATMLDPPMMGDPYHGGALEDIPKQDQLQIRSTDEKQIDSFDQTKEDLKAPSVEPATAPSIQQHKHVPPRRAALNAQELVKSLVATKLEEKNDDHSNSSEGETDRDSPVEPFQSGIQIGKRNPATRKKQNSAPEAKKSFNRPNKLESRRRIVDGRLEWVCLDCEAVFQSCLKLKSHRRNCEYVRNERSKRFGSFPCDICGNVLRTFSALTVHRYRHGSGKPTAKDKEGMKQKICHVCGKQFRSARSLNTHLSTHASDKKYLCQICDKSFARKRYLRNHMDVHSGSKNHVCTICDKKFTTSIVLRNHRETHKPNYLRQQCTICSKRFAHPYQLRKHTMIHTEEYPYSCDVCGALFRRPQQLNRHLEKGHGPPRPLQAEQPNETIDFDDLIVYQPEDDLVGMLDTIPEEMPQLAQVSTTDALPAEEPFRSDHLLDAATRDFTVQCFPGANEADHEIYYFMEF